MASLTETAKAVLEGKTLQEGIYPEVSPGVVSNPNPVDPSTASTANAKTLRPGSKAVEGRHPNPGAPDPTGSAEDLGGATPTTVATDNLGAKAAAGKKRDTSVKGSGTHAEPTKHLEEDEEVDGDVFSEEDRISLAERLKALKEARKMYEKEDEDEEENCEEEFELSEELEDFINEAIEYGLSEEEIMEAIDENFEFISEEEELDEEQIDELKAPTAKTAHAAYDRAERSDDIEGDWKRSNRLYSYLKKKYPGKSGRNQKPTGKAKLPSVSNTEFHKDGYSGHVTKKGKLTKSATKDTKADIKSRLGRHTKPNLPEEYEDLSEELQNYEVDMFEHVNALLEGENLSEEFHAKATTIFEAAVKSKLEEEVALLEQAYAETLEERVNEIMEELASNVDDYLNYVVEQWIEENEVAVESALRSELTEDFISGLRALFAEHYIDVPEDSVNVVEELSSTVEELEAKLNEEIQRNVELTSVLSEARKAELIGAVCEGLTDVQADKLSGLLENVAYTSDEEFISKIETLRENYFPVAVKNDSVLDKVESSNDPQSLTENLEGPMANYVKALGRTLPR